VFSVSNGLYILTLPLFSVMRVVYTSKGKSKKFGVHVIYTKNHCYYPGTFLGITPVSSVSNGLYFLTLLLVRAMRVIYTSKGMSKNLGCALYIRCTLPIEKYGSCLTCNVAFGNSVRIAENNNLGKDVERFGRGVF
jgi:hypothetical protein